MEPKTPGQRLYELTKEAADEAGEYLKPWDQCDTDCRKKLESIAVEFERPLRETINKLKGYIHPALLPPDLGEV